VKDWLDSWEELDRRPYEPNTPLPSDLPPPPPPPPQSDYISRNPKEREIDPVVTCVLAFVVLSSIDASIRWAKLLPQVTVNLTHEGMCLLLPSFFVMASGSQGNDKDSFSATSLATCNMQWEVVLGFAAIELVLNTTYLVLLQRSNRVCSRQVMLIDTNYILIEWSRGCTMGLVYPSWWLLTLLSIATIIRFRIPFQRIIWSGANTVAVVHLIALCFWIGTILLLIVLVLMMIADDFLNRSENDGAIVSLNIGRVMLVGIWITVVYIYPPWRRYIRR
jgi:hypothetical protein